MSRYTRQFSLLVIVVLAALLMACNAPSERGSVNNGNAMTIQVTANDFSFSLEAAQVDAGKVTFVVDNDGSMPHDFAIRGNGLERRTTMIEPGENAALAVDLEPGTYSYICSVPGHEQLGMSGTLIVTAK